ncbi:Group II intron-encoded protein LtrA [Zostera marina]|uniref:Group II intron-encoded protein LtrA n=1 Tax=Zostera marina TaxID=29655 RepID=A0A0K9PY50_ZOSMR|nr:Group II intron-encoded protein LtrA [Zostera marina]
MLLYYHHYQQILRRLTTSTASSKSLPSPASLLRNTYDPLTSDPTSVISALWIHCFNPKTLKTPIPNLTGYLKKLDLWILAYQRSTADLTGAFPSPSAIPHSRLLSLRDTVLSGSFLWCLPPSLQTLRSPKLDPTKSLKKSADYDFDGETTFVFQDRVVQELLLLLVEPVFESRFSAKSHAFRPGRSPHTVIRTIRSNFAGYLWFIKCDLGAVCDRMEVGLVMECFRKGLGDRKILNLIKSSIRGVDGKKNEKNDGRYNRDSVGKLKLRNKRMKRKVMRMVRRKKLLKEDEPKPDPYWLRVFYSFVPEEAKKIPAIGSCGILTPLIANVCLNELDNWIEEKIGDYFQPSKIDSITDGCHNPSWPEFVPTSGRDKTRRMDFVRYGTHVLIGIRGPRGDAVRFRTELIDFCESKYGVKLENTKVEIEHITRGISFLDHVICRRVIHPTLHYTATGGKIVKEKGVGTLLSVTANLERCISKFRRLDLVKGDRDPEPLPCVAMFYSGQAHTNSQMNKFLETMADWYRYADNRKKVVGFCAYVIRSSLAKLYAARYRLKSRAKVYKIAARDLSKPLIEHSRNDMPEYSDLLRMGLVDAIDGVQFSHMSLIPSCDYAPFPRNWTPDHERVLKDYIRLQDPKIFCELYRSVKRGEIGLPQDDLSETVWDWKTHGVRSSQFRDNMARIGGA